MYAMSANGATTIGTSSHGIGDELDFALLNHARQWSDCVLVGAETIRRENYFGVRSSPALAAAREYRGQAPVPPIVTLSRSLDLDPDSQFFRDTAVPPLILTPPDPAPAPERAAAAAALTAAGGEVQEVDTASPAAVLAELHRRGFEKILVEGGFRLFAQFYRAELFDVVYATVAPLLLPAAPSRPDTFPARPLHLDSAVTTADSMVFLRYRAARLT